MGLNLLARIELDSEKFEEGMEHSIDKVKDFVLESVGIASVGELFKKTAETAMEFAEQVKQGAERLGITTDEFQKFAYAATKTNTDVGTFEGALDRLARAQEEAKDKMGNTRNALYSLGLSLEDIRQMSPAEIFDKVSESIAETGTNSERTAALMAVFGRGAGTLIPMMKELRENKDESRGLIVNEEDIKMVDEAKGKLAGLGQGLKSAATTLTGGLLRQFFDPNFSIFSNMPLDMRAQKGALENRLALQQMQKEADAGTLGMTHGKDSTKIVDISGQMAEDHKAALDIEKQITEEKERQRTMGLTEAQKKVELAKEIADLQREIQYADYEGLGEKEVAEKKLQLTKLEGAKKEADFKDKPKIQSDSLLKVGNFLGSNAGMIRQSSQIEQHARATATNTANMLTELKKLSAHRTIGSRGSGEESWSYFPSN